MHFAQFTFAYLMACLGLAFAAGPDAAESRTTAGRPSERLTLAGVLHEVRIHNPAVIAARRRVASMRAKIPQERAWEDPALVLANNVVGDLDQSVAVQQAFPVSGRNLSRGRMAEAEAAGAWQEARKAELEAVRDAGAAFYKYATANGLMDLNARNDRLLQGLAKTARSRFEVGDQTQTDVLMAEGELARNSEARVDIERDAGEAQSALNRLMNRSPEATLPMPETLPASAPVPDLATAQAHALKHSPEVRLALAKIASGQARLQLAHRQWIPDPMAGVKVRRFREPGQDTLNAPMDEVMLELSVSLPWMNGGKYTAGVRDAEAALAAAKADLQAAQTDAMGHVRDALRKAESFLHHVELYRGKILPLSREALKSAQLGYESGKATLAEVLAAQRKLSDDEATTLRHQLEAQTAMVELGALTGGN